MKGENMYYNGKDYDLAKRTINIAQAIEMAERSDTIISAYQNQLAMVKAAIGEDAASEILGPSFNDMDLNELVILYNAIIDEYDAPIFEANAQKEAKLFATPAISQIDKMAKSVDTILKAADRIK